MAEEKKESVEEKKEETKPAKPAAAATEAKSETSKSDSRERPSRPSSDRRPRNTRPQQRRPYRRYYRRQQKQIVPAYVDWKDVDYLQRFVPERGKIMPRRISGVTAKDQRRIARAIKRARVMALLPYVGD